MLGHHGRLKGIIVNIMSVAASVGVGEKLRGAEVVAYDSVTVVSLAHTALKPEKKPFQKVPRNVKKLIKHQMSKQGKWIVSAERTMVRHGGGATARKLTYKNERDQEPEDGNSDERTSNTANDGSNTHARGRSGASAGRWR